MGEEEHDLIKRFLCGSDFKKFGTQSKKLKASNQQIEFPFDILKLKRPLGLSLSINQAFIHLIEAKINEGKKTTSPKTSETPTKKAKISPSVAEKLKASNFSIAALRVGSWKVMSRRADELMAKCYFAKRKLVWEVLQRGLKSKIEIPWSDISAIRATFRERQPDILEVELSNAPLFFEEMDPQPRKHTLWQVTSDFTGGQATMCRRHCLQFPEGTLEKHYEKLLQFDRRLFMLSQRQFPTLSSPYFNSNLFQCQDLPYEFNGYQLDSASRAQFSYLGVHRPTSTTPTSLPLPSVPKFSTPFPYPGVRRPTSTPQTSLCIPPVPKFSTSPRPGMESNNGIKRQKTSLNAPHLNSHAYQNLDFSYGANRYQLQSATGLQVPHLGAQRPTSDVPKPSINTMVSTSPMPVLDVQQINAHNNGIQRWQNSQSSSNFNSNAYQNQDFLYDFEGCQLESALGIHNPYFGVQGPISASPVSVWTQGIHDKASIQPRKGGQVRDELGPFVSPISVEHFLSSDRLTLNYDSNYIHERTEFPTLPSYTVALNKVTDNLASNPHTSVHTNDNKLLAEVCVPNPLNPAKGLNSMANIGNDYIGFGFDKGIDNAYSSSTIKQLNEDNELVYSEAVDWLALPKAPSFQYSFLDGTIGDFEVGKNL